MDNGRAQNRDHQQELQHRFPRAGFWFGMLDRHPDIHPVLDQLRNDQDMANPGQYAAPPNQQPPAPLQANYAYPDYYNPGFASVYAPYMHGYHQPIPFAAPVPPQVPPPAQAHPPYYMDRPAQATKQPTAPANNTIDTRFVTLSIPRNTGVPDGVVMRVTLRLETNLVFNDFFLRVCAHMDLQPNEAQIGYKFSGDRVSDVPYHLSNAEELQTAMDKAVEKIRRARTRDVVMEIHNLQPAIGKTKKMASSKTNKRKADTEHDENDDDTTISAATQLRTLKQKLFCNKHDAYCYVNPISAEHKALNTKSLTLWAKEICLNEATYDTPPFIKDFDHFKQNAKKARRSVNPGGSNVNIYVSPLGDVTHRVGNLSINGSERKALISHIPGPLIKYPTVVEVLRELDDFLPLVNYPSYGDAFTRNGVIYANAVLALDELYLTDVIGMPCPIVPEFVDHTTRLVIPATKGKAKAEVDPPVKNEDEEDLFKYIKLFD